MTLRQSRHLTTFEMFRLNIVGWMASLCSIWLGRVTIFCAQACPDGFAVFGIQARFLSTVDTCLPWKPKAPNPDNIRRDCLSPKDGAGITGLRLFCSIVTEVIVQPHKRSRKTLEFPGSIGDWGEKLTCQDGQWVTEFEIRFATDTEIPLEHLGIVQMGLRCKSNPPEKKKATSEGIVTAYGEKSGRRRTLRTEDPTIWQHNLLEEDLLPWVNARKCKTSFIMGAKVQTDQNDRKLSILPEGTNPDMVGINNVKLACDIYGKSTTIFWKIGF